MDPNKLANPDDLAKKPFAILWLTTLRLAKFDTKQEFKDAILTLQNNGTEFIALIYHKDADIYTVPEVI